MALEVARKYLESTLQKELCRRFSSRFDNVTTPELSPFIAVLRMIKVEYAQTKPEVFRTLVAILHDFDCMAGAEHRAKTIKYVRILLSQQPELADFLVSVLPPAPGTAVRDLPHVLHTLQSQSIDRADYKKSDTDRSLLQIDAKKLKKDQVKFFNFTPPSVNAYVASKGVPQKIITSSGLASLSTSTVDVSTKLKTETILQKDNGKSSLDEVSAYPVPAAVHRYVIVNEPGPHIKKADNGKGSNTTVIQIPHGTSAFGLNRFSEKPEGQGSPMSEGECYSESGSDTSSTTSFKITRVRPRVVVDKEAKSSDSDSNSSKIIRHFICDKDGRLRMQVKPSTMAPFKLRSVQPASKADSLSHQPASKSDSPIVLGKKKASFGLEEEPTLSKKTRPDEFVFEEQNKMRNEKSSLSLSYGTSHNARTFPYMQTVVLSNDSATKGAVNASVTNTKTSSNEGKMSPLVQLENMVHKSAMWEDIVRQDVEKKKSTDPAMVIPAYPYSIPAGGPLFNTTAASELAKDINYTEGLPVDLCIKLKSTSAGKGEGIDGKQPARPEDEGDQDGSSGSSGTSEVAELQMDPSAYAVDTPLDLSFHGGTGSEQTGFSTSSSEDGELVICEEEEQEKPVEGRPSPDADEAEVRRHSEIKSKLRVVLCSKLKTSEERF